MNNVQLNNTELQLIATALLNHKASLDALLENLGNQLRPSPNPEPVAEPSIKEEV